MKERVWLVLPKLENQELQRAGFPLQPFCTAKRGMNCVKEGLHQPPFCRINVAASVGKDKEKSRHQKKLPESDTVEYRPTLLSAVTCVQQSEMLMIKEEDNMSLTNVHLLSDTGNHCVSRLSSFWGQDGLCLGKDDLPKEEDEPSPHKRCGHHSHC